MHTETSQAVRAARRPLRQERDAWKRAALGVLVLSVAWNTAISGIHYSAQARWQEEKRGYQDQISRAEAVRDHAVRELGALAAETARERKGRQEQAAAYEALGAWEYLGEFTVTAYCPCSECCGRWADGVTASGLQAGPGIVAVDPDVIPLGSTVVIDGLKYLAADTGSGVEGRHVDICVASHEETVAHGVQAADVWIIQ